MYYIHPVVWILCGIFVFMGLSFVYIEYYKLPDKYWIVITAACVITMAIVFGVTSHDRQEIQQANACRDSITYLRSIGKDVSGMHCDNEFTTKLKAKGCRDARETLAKLGNDVSGIKCEPNS